jgi:Outer membrane protein beta-barrel domain
MYKLPLAPGLQNRSTTLLERSQLRVMKKIALSVFSLSLVLTAPAAFAQGWGIGVSVNAGIQVGTMAPPPQPQPPPQQFIVVEQQPVYIQQPPPRMIVTTVPAYTYTTTTTVGYLGVSRPRGFGIGGFVSGLGFNSSNESRGLGGLGGSLRYRQHPHFATEIAMSAMAGTDYNNDSRIEIPVTLSELFYLNPQNRFQVYGVLGVGVSWAGVEYNSHNAAERRTDTASYTYAGGLAGVGVEWQLSPNFSIYSDVRAFVRTRIDKETRDNPEFRRINTSGREETTNVSVGVLGQLGGIFYF